MIENKEPRQGGYNINFTRRITMNTLDTLTVVDLRSLWSKLNAETMTATSPQDIWDDSYDDYVCCVGGYSD